MNPKTRDGRSNKLLNTEKDVKLRRWSELIYELEEKPRHQEEEGTEAEEVLKLKEDNEVLQVWETRTTRCARSRKESRITLMLWSRIRVGGR